MAFWKKTPAKIMSGLGKAIIVSKPGKQYSFVSKSFYD
jgi:hypothetical protein